MLDYAANAVVYWPVETVRARFEATCENRKEDPAQLLAEQLGVANDEAAINAFWTQVKTNLQAAKIRLVFVADEIPAELRRIMDGWLHPGRTCSFEWTVCTRPNRDVKCE